MPRLPFLSLTRAALVAIIVAAAVPRAHAAASRLVLSSASVRVEIDRRTGAVLSIDRTESGWIRGARQPSGTSFRMLVPLDGERAHVLRGEDQSPPRVQEETTSAATLEWSNLVDGRGRRFAITLHASLAVDERGLRVALELRNDAGNVVEAVEYPALGDLAARFPEGPIYRQNLSYAQLVTAPLSPRFDSDHGYYGTDHPVQTIAEHDSPFVLVTNHRQGYYVAFHDPDPQALAEHLFELEPGWRSELVHDVPPGPSIGGHAVRLSWRAVQMPFVAPGARARLAHVAVAPYVGAWYRGVDVYKAWRAGWFRRAPVPPWVADVHSWQQLRINSAEDRILFRYRDLPRYAAECARHGVKAIQLTGWNDGGQDRNNPSHDPDPRLGTAEDLRGAIAAARKLGVEVVLFSKFTWADRATPRYRSELHRHAILDPYGDPYVYAGYQYDTVVQWADVNTRRFIPMCPLDPAWRAIAAREMAKLPALGASGSLYDEAQHHGNANVCFAERHGHPVAAFTHGGDAALAAALRQASGDGARFLLAGEALQDRQFRDYGLSYLRLWRGTELPERYVDPAVPIMIAVTGFDDRETINRALLMRLIVSYEPFNFKGHLDDFPLTLAYGKRVDELRRRHRDFLWDGEYRAGEGADVRVGDKPHAPIAVYRRKDGKRALVIVNDGADPLRPSVKLDGAAPPFDVASPERPVRASLAGDVLVPPRSAIVLFER